MTKKPALNNAISTNLRLIGTLTFNSNYKSVSYLATAGNTQGA